MAKKKSKNKVKANKISHGHTAKLARNEYEAKLSKLRGLLHEEGFFDDPSKRLLIFTEFKDTLNYLLEKLDEWGFKTACIHGSKAGLISETNPAAIRHPAASASI